MFYVLKTNVHLIHLYLSLSEPQHPHSVLLKEYKNNMKSISLKNVISLIAEVGVVIGIFLLLYELQQNTDIARTNSYQQSIQSLNEVRGLIFSDPEIAEIYSSFMRDGVDGLDNLDLVRIRYIMNSLLGIYENAFFLNESGIFTEQEWGRFGDPACALSQRYDVLLANLPVNPGRSIFADEFNKYLQETC